MKNSHSESYAAAGVDVTAGYEAVNRIKPLVESTYIPGVIGTLGGFGGLFAPNLEGIQKPVLVSGTDGVGTKLKLAFVLDKHDALVALDHRADDVGSLPGAAEEVLGVADLISGDGDDQTHAHIEGVIHVPRIDLALLGDQVKDGGDGEGGGLDAGGEARLHHAGHIFIKAAAGDVADCADVDSVLEQAPDGLDIDVGGLEQLLTQGAAQLGHMGVQGFGVLAQHLADQRETVGVDTGGA